MKSSKKKVLFVAHMDSHIANFHLPYLKWFQDQGYETHVASNSLESTREIKYCDFKHQIDFKRSPFSFKNIKLYKSFKKIVKEHDFELVHAHTPMGGLFTRLAFKREKTAVFYTAHGFHFLKGGPKSSWIMFYPIEKYLSKYTDELLTINREDYDLATKKFSKKVHMSLVNGVGVNLEDYQTTSKDSQKSLKQELNINENDFIMTYVGEHTKGKNQVYLINAMSDIVKVKPYVKLILVGYGKELDNHKKVIKELNLEENILVLGFRDDINNLLSITDLVVSSSLREGLAKAILEALVAGKPLLVSSVRGNKDLVEESVNGLTFDPKDLNDFINKFNYLEENREVLIKYSSESLRKSKDFDLNKVLTDVTTLYNKYLKE